MKKCSKCKKQKSIKYFYKTKSGKNMGYFHSYCIACEAEYKHNRTILLSEYPWYRTYRRILKRIYSNGHHKKYYKDRGIKNFLTVENLKFLWLRDKAYLMKKPSIDRKDSMKSYTLKNCHYIEFSKNVGKG